MSASVVHAFCELHARGLVYRGSYLVNWAPQLQTAVSDLEVEYSDEPGTLFHFRYPLAGGGPDDFLPVATTRPETILGDTAVAVHPEDARYAHLVGRQLEVPFGGGRTVPLIADDYVDREFGTGVLKVRFACARTIYAPQLTRVADHARPRPKRLSDWKAPRPAHHQHHEQGWLYERGCGCAAANQLRSPSAEAVCACRCLCWPGPRRVPQEALGACASHPMRVALAHLVRAQADMQAAGLAIKEEPHTLRVPRSQRGGEARA